MDAKNRVMFVFLGFAVLVGSMCGAWNAVEAKPLLGLFVALIFFYISFKAVTNVLSLEETSFDTGTKNVIKTGFIPYWFIWLVFWILVFNIL
ncbi:hypothetical protein AKJ63_00570 [candidate division MSBL1 archaeon SCGC-AAA259D18]|uniref:Uncharacterized protein n=2 Tax=candidate division MSBL1 TaxID=215777 RepID=A0A133U9P2_9EURY|nr:hypothetical protein AKJ57_03185 [candidate division MSBL1 archaeon SCGC-AAA259A05]KXA91864.1 hypothetical protein AKJ63_00570 [candidate division MSBL1 archaeon SCGC-AAA259D18]